MSAIFELYLIRNINSCALKLIRTIIYVNLAIILLGFPAMGSTRPDPNFQNMGSTQPEKTRNSKIWAQPDPTQISKIWAQPNPKKPKFPRYGLNPTQKNPKFGSKWPGWPNFRVRTVHLSARARAQAQIFKTILYVIYIARSIYT